MKQRRLVRSLSGLVLVALLVTAPLVARAWDLSGPSANHWSVALFEHDWARGDALWCNNVARGAACVSDTLVGFDWAGPGDANNELSSFQICNNYDEPVAFRVSLYRDANYVALFDTQDFDVEAHSCVIRNMAVDDVLTSFRVVSY